MRFGAAVATLAHGLVRTVFPDGSKQLSDRFAARERWQRYVAAEAACLRSTVKVSANGALGRV
jgi:hypothetical protein